MQGGHVEAIRRTFYVYQGTVDRDSGWIELTIDGRAVLFRGHSDGCHLRAIPGHWIDPLEGSLSEENAEFVERHGKFEAFDVSSDLPYSQVIGHTIADMVPLTDLHGQVIGFQLTAADTVLRGWVESDEFYVLFAPW